eukprot:GILJ01005664.1.p1 GENE.GILJ01005664.1~~GILJ01005664.1.p1  ORF type:complete len:117 (+),score=23.08 GILJ01005664.1:50-352(+)
MDKDQLLEAVIQLQQTLSELTNRVEKVKKENSTLKDENILLKDYIDNLMAKIGNLSNVGSGASSKVALARPKRDDNKVQKVDAHIAELKLSGHGDHTTSS